MKHLLLAALLATAASPSFAADRLHNYCYQLSETTRSVVIAYDAKIPMALLNRNNLEANGLAVDDLLMVIHSVYSGALDGDQMQAILFGTHEGCLRKHAVDMQG